MMPGTYGSGLGVGLYLALVRAVRAQPNPRILLCSVTLAIAAVSVWIVSLALRSFTVQDPQQIVLDEVVGQLITLFPLPLYAIRPARYWIAVAAGFVFFRALDAAKPYPIWKLERLKGAWGVMFDDIGAGVLGALLLTGLLRLGGLG